MNDPSPARPLLALVLPGGGAQAAYQVGALHAIAQERPDLSIPVITGVSAGAINAAHLAAHPGPLLPSVEALRAEWGRLSSDMIYSVQPWGLARMMMRWLKDTSSGWPGRAPTIRGILDTQPLRSFLERSIDFGGIDRNLKSGRLKAVGLSATAYSTGITVTFVEGGAETPMWERLQRVSVRTRLTVDHVMASAAIPIVFRAVRMEGEFYGDGSVRQSSPLSPAVHLGADRILAVATRPLLSRPAVPAATAAGEHPSAVETMTLLLDSLFLDDLDMDAMRLTRINRLLRAIPLGAPAPDGLKPVDLLLLRPSRDLGGIAAECMDRIERLPRSIRLLIRAMGVTREAGAGFLSYFLFEPEYTARLIEVGYADARAQMDAIRSFLAPS